MRNKNAFKILAVILLTIFGLLNFYPILAQAEDRAMLSITPLLIKNNVSPGQSWKSAIKIVNNNSYEINIYVQTADFQGGNEDGTVKFIDAPAEDAAADNYLLSRWIKLEKELIAIPAQQSREIPFIIHIPDTAEPGGHYAAILAGTKPPADEKIQGGSAIKISALLGSLILLKIDGEITEKGSIREFSTNKKFYTEPKVDFTVRLSNIGNVHIQPQGEIRIYNYFNKHKGAIRINHGTEFGNVLPQGTRKWNFSWEGQGGLQEMGRYRANLILGYGEQERSTVDQALYFWYIDIKLLSITIGFILLLIFIIIFSVRGYIKRAIKKTGLEAGFIAPRKYPDKQAISIIPEENHTVNLKNVVKSGSNKKNKAPSQNKKYSWRSFLKYVKLILIILCVMLGATLYFYYHNHTRGKLKSNNYTDYQISEPLIDNSHKSEKKNDEISSEQTGDEQEDNDKQIDNNAASNQKNDLEIISTSTSSNSKIATGSTAIIKEQKTAIVVLNGGGQAGAARAAADILEKAGWPILKIENADNFNYYNNIIKYQKISEEDARAISRLFSGQIEMQEVDSLPENIIFIVGGNFEF